MVVWLGLEQDPFSLVLGNTGLSLPCFTPILQTLTLAFLAHTPVGHGQGIWLRAFSGWCLSAPGERAVFSRQSHYSKAGTWNDAASLSSKARRCLTHCLGRVVRPWLVSLPPPGHRGSCAVQARDFTCKQNLLMLKPFCETCHNHCPLVFPLPWSI